MKSLLLLLSVVVGMTGTGSARAQYIYFDTNGDGVCNFSDFLGSRSTVADVYLDTNHNVDGSQVTCATNPSQPLDIFSYDLFFRTTSDPGTSITLNDWTNAMPGFTVLNPFTVVGHEAGVGYTAPVGTILPTWAVQARHPPCNGPRPGECVSHPHFNHTRYPFVRNGLRDLVRCFRFREHGGTRGGFRG